MESDKYNNMYPGIPDMRVVLKFGNEKISHSTYIVSVTVVWLN